MLLKNARVLNSLFKFSNSDISINNGKIENIYIPDEYDFADYDEVIDLSGLTILPGLIDIHTHGCMGYDTMDASDEALETMSKFMVSTGVTTFLPTSMSGDYNWLEEVFTNIKSVMDKGIAGANIAGIHMEGPYFSPHYKGAQNERFLRLPSRNELFKLQTVSGGNIKIVSMAPELEGSFEFIDEAVKQGIVVSLGHTGADYDTAVSAVEYGASHVTHLFNAMAAFQHRAPGLIGAAFDKNMTLEIICDGVHLHPAVVRAVYKIAALDKIVFVSDSIRATGLSDGSYDLGGQEIYVKKGVARIKNGTIAGSTATLLYCIKKAVGFGIKLEDAVRMATINPAKVIGLDANKGSIQQGKDADLLVINDNFELIYTFVNGKLVVNNS